MSVPGNGDSLHRGPEAEMCLVCPEVKQRVGLGQREPQGEARLEEMGEVFEFY